jgi:hypothetical protein
LITGPQSLDVIGLGSASPQLISWQRRLKYSALFKSLVEFEPLTFGA